MPHLTFFIGQAGTGKTKQLMDATRQANQEGLLREHQCVLALSVMRGAIRRLEEKLALDCPDIAVEVTTIDSFALRIVNRWRRSLGFSEPIVPTTEANSFEGPFNSHLPFERICAHAANLMTSSTVGKLTALSYPIVVIDEFQDCYGPKLDFVKKLAVCCRILAAADEFQLLEDVQGCPAMSWISEVERQGARVTRLTEGYRCSVSVIVKAAQSLRENKPTTENTIPVYCCPRWKMAATKLIFHNPKGNMAIVSPTHKPLLGVLTEYGAQLHKQGRAAVYWRLEKSKREGTTSLLRELALTEPAEDIWRVPKGELSVGANRTVEYIEKNMRLRGLERVTTRFASSLAEKAMSEDALWEHRGKRLALTVHSAKNREFDNVVVLWDPYTLKKWTQDKQRRCLYNALTRARLTCIVLYLAGTKSCEADPVLNLVGPPRLAFASRNAKSSRSSKKKLERN